MGGDEGEPEPNGSLANWFPDPAALLGFEQKSIPDIMNSCHVVLDANALLTPYGITSKSLEEISELLNPLAAQGRLFIPVQALREFLKNRGKKVEEAHRRATSAASLSVKVPDLEQIRFMNETEEYSALVKAHDALKSHAKKLQASVNEAGQALAERMSSPAGTDPVSKAYRPLIA